MYKGLLSNELVSCGLACLYEKYPYSELHTDPHILVQDEQNLQQHGHLCTFFFSIFFLECALQSLQYKAFTCKLYSLQGSIISNGKSFKPCPKPQGFQPS